MSYIIKPFNQSPAFEDPRPAHQPPEGREYYQRQILAEPSAAVIPDADREFIQHAMKIVEENLATLLVSDAYPVKWL